MKKQFGFTLINLAVTLSVGGVVLALGVPAFLEMASTNRLVGHTNNLVGAIRMARSEAVKRTGDATICASNPDQTACLGNAWVNGWIVFTDDDGDEAIGPDDEIIKIWDIAELDNDGQGVDLLFQGAPNAIRFDGTGILADGAAAVDFELEMFDLEEGDCYGGRARQISISTMGRTSVGNVACF